MPWDVFISHASEDKQAVALPLAAMLMGKGVSVWLDKHQLRLGDRLRERIDDGLRNSRFGVVVLSDAFFGKDWPRNELDGLLALEADRCKRILPVWHGIGSDRVAEFSPLLAARLAISTSKGLDAVANSILDVLSESNASKPQPIVTPNSPDEAEARRRADLVSLCDRALQAELDALLGHNYKSAMGQPHLNPYAPENFTTWRSAAEQGIATGQYLCGTYLLERGAREEATMWLELAAANGVARAMGRLGEFLVDEGDVNQGVTMVRRAAEAGDAHAAHTMCDYIRCGLAGTRSLQEFMRWVRRAAELGNTHAQSQIDLDQMAPGFLKDRFQDRTP